MYVKVISPPTYRATVTGSGVIALTVDPRADNEIVGDVTILQITIVVDDTPTDADKLTFTLDSNEGAAYDAIINESGVGKNIDGLLVWTDHTKYVLKAKDKLVIAYANTGTDTVSIAVLYALGLHL